MGMAYDKSPVLPSLLPLFQIRVAVQDFALVMAQAALVENQHHRFQEEEGSLFEQAAGALHRLGFLVQGQFGGPGNADGNLGLLADGRFRVGGQGQGAGPQALARRCISRGWAVSPEPDMTMSRSPGRTLGVVVSPTK